MLETVQVQSGIPLGALEGRNHGVQRGLAGHAGHGADGQVHHVHAGLRRQQAGGHLVAGGVVGMELDGDADLLLQCGDQLLCGVGLQDAGHILDGQHMGTPVLQFLRQLHIVVQRIFIPLGVQDVAGIADGGLANFILVQHLVHGDFHAGEPVQGVEHPEHIHAGAGGLLDELPNDVVGVVGVAYGVGAPEEHLQQQVGCLLADEVQPLPGGFVEEAVGHIKGGAAPALQGEGVRQDLAGALHALHNIAGTDPGGQQGLVGVAAGGVGDEQLLLVQHPVRNGLGALGVQHLLQAVGAVSGDRREPGRIVELVAVLLLHHDIADVFQHLGGPVLALVDLEQLRRLVDELRVALARHKGWVFQNIGDKGDVGLDAPDVDLVDGPDRLAAHALKGVVPGGDLHQQGVIVGGDDRAGIGVAAVQPDAEAAGGAVGRDLAGIGSEVVGGVLGGDAALDGIAVLVDVRLAGNADLRVAEGTALGDQDLGAHQVDARHHLGDGVLHLDAGVHLDEIVVAFLIHQELQGARVDVADVLGNFDRVVVKGLPHLRRHGEGRGELHHLLIPPLERAVPLVQMDHIALLVPQHLDLDVLGLHQELLHEDVVIAEGLLGLGLYQVKVDADLLHGVAPAHATAAAACRSLQNDGEAELHGQLLGLLPAFQRLRGAGCGGHAALHRHLLGGELVAHHIQNAGAGADELDARLLAGPGEVAVLGQEAVAGMDGVGAVLFGQADDAVNIQIRTQRALILPNGIRLVSSRAEQAVCIFIGVNGNGLQVQIMAGPENAHSDLAAVRDQHLFEHSAHKVSSSFI